MFISLEDTIYFPKKQFLFYEKQYFFKLAKKKNVKIGLEPSICLKHKAD